MSASSFATRLARLEDAMVVVVACRFVEGEERLYMQISEGDCGETVFELDVNNRRAWPVNVR
jgi:hypothetical protein